MRHDYTKVIPAEFLGFSVVTLARVLFLLRRRPMELEHESQSRTTAPLLFSESFRVVSRVYPLPYNIKGQFFRYRGLPAHVSVDGGRLQFVRQLAAVDNLIPRTT